MPKLLEILISDSKADPDIKMEDAAMPSKSEYKGMVVKLTGIEGEKRITMNTTALETKVAAVKLLMEIAGSMGRAFAPYIEPVLPIMLELSGYKLSRAIRKNALKSLDHFITAYPNPTLFSTKIFPTLLP